MICGFGGAMIIISNVRKNTEMPQKKGAIISKMRPLSLCEPYDGHALEDTTSSWTRRTPRCWLTLAVKAGTFDIAIDRRQATEIGRALMMNHANHAMESRLLANTL